MIKLFRFVLLLLLSFYSDLNQAQDAILSKMQTVCTVSADGLHISESKEIRINNRDGEKYTKVEIPFTSNDNVLKIKGAIKDKSGNVIRELKKSEIILKNENSSNSLYEDNFVNEFILKHNEYPYYISYSSEILHKDYVYIANWVPVIDLDVPTENSELEIIIPKDQAIGIYHQNIGSYNLDSNGLNYNYRWSSVYNGDLSQEELAPPILSFLPQVKIIKQNFYYETNGSAASWETYGNWLFRMNEGLYDLPESEKSKISSLIKGAGTEREKLEILYTYLQDNTRYIKVSITTGRIKPFSSSYVARNKFGDCKALTVYFKSILDYIGLKSYYSLINTGDPIIKIDTSFPSLQFNHAILYVPLEKEQIWLDCTSSHSFGYTGTFIQNRDVFIVRYEESYFSKTAGLNSEDVAEISKISISPGALGGAYVHAMNKYRGYKYELLDNISSSLNNDGKRQTIIKYFLPINLSDIEFFLEQKDKSDPVIQLVYNGYANHIYNQYGSNIILEILPISLPLIEEPSKRILPVQIDYPVNIIDTIDYDIPPGYQLSENVKDVNFESEFGFYTMRFETKESVLRTTRQFILNSGEYDISKYIILKEFFLKIQDFENSNYIELI